MFFHHARQRRSLHPHLFLTNGREILWIMDVDNTHMRLAENGRFLDLEAPSKTLRNTMAEAYDYFSERHTAAFVPDPRLVACHWPSVADFQAEQNMRRLPFALVDLQGGWDVVCVDIFLGGAQFRNRSWQVDRW